MQMGMENFRPRYGGANVGYDMQAAQAMPNIPPGLMQQLMAMGLIGSAPSQGQMSAPDYSAAAAGASMGGMVPGGFYGMPRR